MQLLTSSQVLTHYDATLPLKMAADASQYGLRAVISHILPEGSKKPIAFASQVLSKSRRRLGLWYQEISHISLRTEVHTGHRHKPLLGRKVYLWLQPPNYRGGLSFWQHINFVPQKLTGMPTLCRDYPCRKGSSEMRMCNLGQIESLPMSSKSVSTTTRCNLILSKVHFLEAAHSHTANDPHATTEHLRVNYS